MSLVSKQTRCVLTIFPSTISTQDIPPSEGAPEMLQIKILQMHEEMREMARDIARLVEAAQQGASTNSQPPVTPTVVAEDPPTSGDEVFDIWRLKATNGAIFDYLYPLIKTPKNVMDAFNIGFAGCPPINSMESRESEYAQVWRAGGKRYKQFGTLRAVNRDIEMQPSKDREHYTITMHSKYTGKLQGALATLTKAISRHKT